MSAKVKPACGPGWIAACEECDDSQHGTMSDVDLWADMHNALNHAHEGLEAA